MYQYAMSDQVQHATTVEEHTLTNMTALQKAKSVMHAEN